jgi:hypothetical protein
MRQAYHSGGPVPSARAVADRRGPRVRDAAVHLPDIDSPRGMASICSRLRVAARGMGRSVRHRVAACGRARAMPRRRS